MLVRLQPLFDALEDFSREDFRLVADFRLGFGGDDVLEVPGFQFLKYSVGWRVRRSQVRGGLAVDDVFQVDMCDVFFKQAHGFDGILAGDDVVIGVEIDGNQIVANVMNELKHGRRVVDDEAGFRFNG